ncbi:hypothetical protein EV360DRAFT_85352 [Lentinula raphanica]|nr:hypothetical protein EV360DRAFT_85352 [Lentinula raphanica]
MAIDAMVSTLICAPACCETWSVVKLMPEQKRLGVAAGVMNATRQTAQLELRRNTLGYLYIANSVLPLSLDSQSPEVEVCASAGIEGVEVDVECCSLRSGGCWCYVKDGDGDGDGEHAGVTGFENVEAMEAVAAFDSVDMEREGERGGGAGGPHSSHPHRPSPSSLSHLLIHPSPSSKNVFKDAKTVASLRSAIFHTLIGYGNSGYICIGVVQVCGELGEDVDVVTISVIIVDSASITNPKGFRIHLQLFILILIIISLSSFPALEPHRQGLDGVVDLFI